MTRVHDLVDVEVEHLLGATSKLPLVKLRATGDGVILLGQLSPADARQIAAHLFEAAARAEYEADFVSELDRMGMGDATAVMLRAIRAGERRRRLAEPEDGARD